MRTLILTALAAALAFSACKKTETESPSGGNNNPSGDPQMDLITASPWVAYRVDVNNLNVWDLLVEDCQKDDTYKFYRDSSLVQYENTDVCPGNDDSATSQWHFYDGRKKLIGTILNITDTATILTLSQTEMKLSVDFSGNPALIYFRKP